MHSLREKLETSSRFLIGTELVSVRGGMAERSAVKARDFANRLIESPAIDWISITDNAGGNPQLGYFEPWDQSKFDPSEPAIGRVQWRNAYRSYRANLDHFQHNLGV